MLTVQNMYWNSDRSDRIKGTPLSQVKLKMMQKMRTRVRLTVFFLVSEHMITARTMLLMRSVKQTGKMIDTYKAMDWVKKQLKYKKPIKSH